MANNITNKIGCQAGKLKIVDPNKFDGLNSSSNMSVPLEDLNISVILRTKKKGRTVLTKEANEGTKESTSSISINFIEGSDDGTGNKVLTTKYTDLTTVFDKDTVNEETLGITSIDIDFNSSMAPMITVNFIDVRGSSIFQNEEKIGGNNSGNKYATFFQLPYPLFELEIKGYYGKPVTYCLHMLKFNSKFNSQTGNFEIQCQFIGYTYAMLSDMLIGYLKAIPFTTIGIEKYKKYNENRSKPILTLVELMKQISLINNGLEKLTADSENASVMNSTTKATESLDLLVNTINTFGSTIDYYKENGIKDKYQYIVKLSAPFTEPEKGFIKDYKDNVEKIITEFNAFNCGASLVVTEFQQIDTPGIGKGFYGGISMEMVDPTLTNTATDEILGQKLGSPTDLPAFKKSLYNYLKANYSGLNEKAKIDVYNMNLLFDKITKAKSLVDKTTKTAKEGFANELKETVAETLGFDPTVRNIIEIFTAAVEVFMETIFDVSVAAEADITGLRLAQLEPKFGVDLVNSDIPKEYLDSKKYFSWPDYREKDEKENTYVEKYLGEKGVLDIPTDVNELAFIDDLLAAFLKAGKISEEVKANEDELVSTWFAVNPLDTLIYTDSEPYSRMKILNYSDVARLMVIRGMTFLGYTNEPSLLTNDEIVSMAEIEADAIIRNVESDTIKQSLSLLQLSSIIDSTGVINSNDTKVVLLMGDEYIYNYIGGEPVDTATKKYKHDRKNMNVVLPINNGFSGDWPINSIENLDKRGKNGYTFLTNYGRAYGKSFGTNSPSYEYINKPNDGGIYVKILKPQDYNKDVELYTAPEKVKPENTLVLSKLMEEDVDSSAGYNSFGGTFGIQEYVNMDFGGGVLDKLPLMYVFYKDFDNGLASNRKNSGIQQKIAKDNRPTDSFYDLKKTGNIRVINDDKENIYKSMTNKFYLHANLGQNRTLLNGFINNGFKDITYPYIETRMDGVNTTSQWPRDTYSDNSFSLFGSEYYYYQDKAKCILQNGDTFDCQQYAKAMLFLHTLPFNTENNAKTLGFNLNNSSADPFGKNEIIHLFDKKGGFIHAPRLWCAYIGSILWRINNPNNVDKNGDEIPGSGVQYPIIENGLIVGGGSGKKDPLIWIKGKNFKTSVVEQVDFIAPTRKEYYPNVLDTDDNLSWFGANYPNIADGNVINRLPQQVKDEFKRIFFEFVNGTDGMLSWSTIKEKLEIWDGSSDDFAKFVENLHTSVVADSQNNYEIPVSLILSEPNVKNIDSYEIMTIITPGKDKHKFYLFLELKGDYSTNDAVKNIIDGLTQELIIVNTGWEIWQSVYGGSKNTFYQNLREPIKTKKEIFELYFNTIITKLKTTADAYSPNNIKKNLEQSIFGTTNEDTIKLVLYRTCKNIRDKWLAGTSDADNIMYQCGGTSGRSNVDKNLATEYGNKLPKFIDTFRFVSRSFQDIGRELYINPLPINDYLVENTNTSAYDSISSLLASNNFDFVALPNFINFRDEEEIEAIFKPYGNYQEAIKEGSCGPSFVCVYTGVKSKHLDFKNADYPNDGVDFRCVDSANGSSNVDMAATPSDFTNETKDYEDGMGVFTVKYSQQNQNIFKDIDLDQSEFSETDESLQIQEDISQKGSETNRSIAGQNIYNVYSVRSYTAKVEMMGNAMIQPMMYFQLDNIPMFHGAYMITRVKHSIKPNSMMTNFTGVRIKYTKTPTITAMDLYMSLADTIDTSQSSGTSVSSSGKLSPVVNTIYENGGVNGNIVAGNIKTKLIPKIKGITNDKLNTANNILLAEAVNPLVEMLTEWVNWQINNKYPGGGGGIYGGITSVFRDYEKQKELENNGGAIAGTSYHGWGVAVDLQFYDADGKIIRNTKNTPTNFSKETNPTLIWLLDNSYKYGWVLPINLRDGKSLEEHWHFEYHGTAAKCLMENNSTTYGHKTIVNMNQKPVVTNPIGKDGKPSIYTTCDYIVVKDIGDGTEKDSTLTKPELAENQIKVKNFFKAKGYTKEQAAGIMGNIQQESNFNPSALNKKDLNGYASFGLIQWNEKYTTRAEAGSTLETQLNYLIGMSTFKKWVNLSEPKTSVEESTFKFAKFVEICHLCNKSYQTYKSSYQYVRTQYANDIFTRFNNPKDSLAW